MLSVPREMESGHSKRVPVSWIYGSLQLQTWNAVKLSTKLEILPLTETMLKWSISLQKSKIEQVMMANTEREVYLPGNKI